jgi:NADH-quinone oxidoreductase subunit J
MPPLPLLLLCSSLIVVTGALVVFLRRPVRGAVALLGHSLSLALLYLFLDAELMAAAQTVIYSGAIVVLFLIVVALLPEGKGEPVNGAARWLVALALAASVGGGVLFALDATALPRSFATSAPGIEAIGRPLFHELVAAFELTAPLLLAALVAAVLLWRRHEPVSKERRP